jgi:hypothetical protein
VSVRRAAVLGLWLAFVVSGAVRAADGGIAISTDPLSLLSTFGFPTVAVVALVREIVVPIGRLNEVKARRDEALAGWKAQTDATLRLAAAIEERNRIEAAEKRK